MYDCCFPFPFTGIFHFCTLFLYSSIFLVWSVSAFTHLDTFSCYKVHPRSTCVMPRCRHWRSFILTSACAQLTHERPINFVLGGRSVPLLSFPLLLSPKWDVLIWHNSVCSSQRGLDVVPRFSFSRNVNGNPPLTVTII